MCALADLPPGAVVTAAAGGRDVVLWNNDGSLVALENRCAHKDLPLNEGVVQNGVVTCPSHLWRYDIASGQRVDSPGWSVPSYPVTIDEGSVVVEVPEPEPPSSIWDQLLQHAKEWRREP